MNELMNNYFVFLADAHVCVWGGLCTQETAWIKRQQQCILSFILIACDYEAFMLSHTQRVFTL